MSPLQLLKKGVIFFFKTNQSNSKKSFLRSFRKINLGSRRFYLTFIKNVFENIRSESKCAWPLRQRNFLTKLSDGNARLLSRVRSFNKNSERENDLNF